MIGTDDESCSSPISCVDSVCGGIEQCFSTPATSPASSPVRLASKFQQLYIHADGSQDDDAAARLSDHVEHRATAKKPQLTLSIPESLSLGSTSIPGTAQLQDPGYAVQTWRRLRPLGIDQIDRFIPARSATPTKQALLLSKAGATPSKTTEHDPFLTVDRRQLNIANRYAVLRDPARARRAAGFSASSINSNANRSRVSQQTIWTANSLPVTEGVLSTTNRRGGRITSNSNAPHFCADLLRMTEEDQGLEQHERRLALAMDVDRTQRLFKLSMPASVKGATNRATSGTQFRTWIDNRWQSDKIFEAPKASSPEKIPAIPYRVLDAPTLRDDFYCSLLAYCPALDCLAVGLANHIYIWSEKGRRSDNLPESLVSQHNTNHVTSLSFSSVSRARSILAIGRFDGLLSLWHPLDRQPRLNKKHTAPISFVSFRPFTSRRPSIRDTQIMVDTEELLIGDDHGTVLLYSVEWPTQDQCNLFDWDGCLTLRAVITCHTQQVCGIAWSVDGEQFATGANDNRLSVFAYSEVDRSSRASASLQVRQTPAQRLLARTNPECAIIGLGNEKKSFSLNAAVKAIAFAPWQSDLLVAGGGSNDRCVHFFHIGSGARLATINCHAQVTSVVWNTHRRELAVTLGFAQPKHSFRVVVIAWPSCVLLASIPWLGEERALYAIPFPGGPAGRRDPRRQTLVIATSDASIKFHEVWPKRKVKDKRTLVDVESQILSDTCSTALLEEGLIR